MENQKGKRLWLRKAIPKTAPDFLAVVGCTAITYGVGIIYLPAGWIVGGIFSIAAAVLWSWGKGGAAD